MNLNSTVLYCLEYSATETLNFLRNSTGIRTLTESVLDVTLESGEENGSRIFHRQRKNGNDIAVNENSKSETESAIAKDGSGIDVVSVRLSQRESSGSINGQSSCGLIDGEGQREEKENLELSNNKRGGKAK